MNDRNDPPCRERAADEIRQMACLGVHSSRAEELGRDVVAMLDRLHLVEWADDAE